MKDKKKKENAKKVHRKWLTIKCLMEIILYNRRTGKNVPKIKRRTRYPC